MEGFFMNGLWKKRIPAFLLTLVMIVSLMPAALADEPNDENTSPEGHTHSFSWATTKEATCTEAGVRTGTCTVSNCSETTTESLPSLGHQIGSWTTDTEANCTTPGSQSAICSRCNETQTRPINALGHKYGNWTTNKEATCTEKGERTRVCETCGTPQTEPLPLAEHTYNNSSITEVPATCTNDGSRTYTCAVCRKVGKTEAIKALGHTDANGDGKCDRIGCGATVSHVHTPGSWQKNDTMHWHICSICQTRMDESAHSYTLNNNTTCICGVVKAANTFTVRFYNGSTVVSTQTVAQNGYPTVPSPPTKGTGYVFKGWVTSNPGNTLWTSATSIASPATQAITKATDYYAIYSVSATAAAASVSATTNIGGLLWNQINTRCTSSYGMTPVYVRFSSLPSSTYGTLYSDSAQSRAVVTNSDYQYTGFLSMTFKAGTASGYSLGYTAYDATRSNSISGTITIGGTTTSNKIEYTVAAGRSKTFSATDFRNVYRAAAGSDTNLSYVVFSAPSDYSDFGAVTNGSRTFTQRNLSDDEFYYSNSKDGDYPLDSTAFKADSNAKSGTLKLSFVAYGSGNNVSGTVEITITGTAKGDVTYNVRPGRQETFNAKDFNDAFQKVFGDNRTDITHVVFSAPSSYDSFRGQLLVGSKTFTRSTLNGTKFYFDTRRYGDYDLDLLAFKADSNAKEGDSISIPFKAYYDTGNSDYENCTLVINIGDGVAGGGDINYDVAPGKTVEFKAKDFCNYYEDNASDDFDYVEFDQPDSDAFSQGALHHNYGTNSAKSFTRSNLDDFKFYYSPGSKDYGIGNLTFAANNSFKDTVILDFTAYGTRGRSVSGTVAVRSTESGSDGDVTYTVIPGKSVDFKRTDFNTYFRKKYNSTVSYVSFERPSSTAFSNGTLYCDYGTNDQTSFSRSELSGTRFFYNKNDMGKKDYYLDELTFVANSSFKGSITLNFTAYGERDDEYVEGSVVIKADGAAAVTSSYTGGIRYATITGTNVQINANDIARYFRKSYPTYNLQYVTLNGVPAAGSLYYNYYNASSYGTTSRTQITSANYAGQSFYLSPTSTSQYALTELTYVPSGTSYCASIPFTAYGTSGVSVTGSILISVSRAQVSEVYGVTPKNTAVSFPASSIYSAVLSATGSALSGIQLLELPAATTGTVYIGTGTDRADTRTMYTYASGANQMSLLRFVPTASYTGSVEIPYVALDANGNALATGSFSLGVLNNRKTLKDVNSSTWCYKYVMELTDQNVISGYTDGSFKPNSTVTYGAALKLIMLAAGYSEQAPTGTNVFSGYLSKAQADGIVTRSNVNLSAPITRLQVAQLAAGALKLSTSNLSSVKPFTDTSDVYVQALNAAGIVEGYFSNGTSTFRPSNTLTRGQMSAIVWRMNEYRK